MKSVLRLVREVVTMSLRWVQASVPIMATFLDAQALARAGPLHAWPRRERDRDASGPHSHRRTEAQGRRPRPALAQLEPQTDTIDGIGILTPLQRVPRPAPAETPAPWTAVSGKL